MTSRQAKLLEDACFSVMSIEQENLDVTQREHAEKLGISIDGLNHCLKALMEKGLVKTKKLRHSPEQVWLCLNAFPELHARNSNQHTSVFATQNGRV